MHDSVFSAQSLQVSPLWSTKSYLSKHKLDKADVEVQGKGGVVSEPANQGARLVGQRGMD